MKFLICDEDLSSGKLCGSCQAKLVREELNQLEVETCKALFELTKTADLTNNELLKVREMKGGEFALVLVRGELGPLIGKHGKNLKQLIKSVGKKIRFVRYDQDNKAKISDLIKPLNLISISNIFESDSGNFCFSDFHPFYIRTENKTVAQQRLILNCIRKNNRIIVICFNIV